MTKKMFKKRVRNKKTSNPFKITAILDTDTLPLWKSIGNSSEWVRHELKYHFKTAGMTLEQKQKRALQELVGLKAAYEEEQRKMESYYHGLIYAKQKELEDYRDIIEEKKVQTQLTEIKEAKVTNDT